MDVIVRLKIELMRDRVYFHVILGYPNQRLGKWHIGVSLSSHSLDHQSHYYIKNQTRLKIKINCISERALIIYNICRIHDFCLSIIWSKYIFTTCKDVQGMIPRERSRLGSLLTAILAHDPEYLTKITFKELTWFFFLELVKLF